MSLHDSLLSLLRIPKMQREPGKHHASLTRADVVDMRQRYANGEDTIALAKAYGVTRACAAAAIGGKTWADVPGAVKMRKPNERLSPEQKAKIMRGLRETEDSWRDIAKQAGVSKATVGRFAKFIRMED